MLRRAKAGRKRSSPAKRHPRSDSARLEQTVGGADVGCPLHAFRRRPDVGRTARRFAPPAARDRRAGGARPRRPRGDRARDLVGAGSLAQPRHQCAGAQHAGPRRRDQRRPDDAIARNRDGRAPVPVLRLGLAPAHPPSARSRARADDPVGHRRLRRRGLCLLPAAEQGLAAADRAGRRGRRLHPPRAAPGCSADRSPARRASSSRS